MAKEQKKRLGKGLSSLLGDVSDYRNPNADKARPDSAPAHEAGAEGSVSEIEVALISPNPYQPRKQFDEQMLQELSASIKEQGVIQPITVRKLAKDEYQLISGERRLRASKLAGLAAIPAYVREATNQQMQAMALIENIQRADLNAIEIANSYTELIKEHGLSHDEVAKVVGKKRETVSNYLRLLKLPPEVQQGVRDQYLSMGHARALINLDNVDQQLALYQRILNEKLSVRKVEELVKQFKEPAAKPAAAAAAAKVSLPPELQEVQDRLESQFGRRVRLAISGSGKGEIKIPYHSEQELNDILEQLNYFDSGQSQSADA